MVKCRVDTHNSKLDPLLHSPCFQELRLNWVSLFETLKSFFKDTNYIYFLVLYFFALLTQNSNSLIWNTNNLTQSSVVEGFESKISSSHLSFDQLWTYIWLALYINSWLCLWSCTLFFFSLLHAGIHRKRSDVSDWTRAWKASSDGVNSLYMHVNLYLCFLPFFCLF